MSALTVSSELRAIHQAIASARDAIRRGERDRAEQFLYGATAIACYLPASEANVVRGLVAVLRRAGEVIARGKSS